MFITLEGIDGSGKTTASTILREHILEKYGIAAKQTSELLGSRLGVEIRELLSKYDVNPIAELALIIAARQQHIAEFLMPALSSGDWVICDRYLHSTLAYQGSGRGLGFQKVIDAHTFIDFLPLPDLVINIDVSPSVAKLRMRQRGNDRLEKFDSLGAEFYAKARQGFRDGIGAKFSKNFVTVTNESISLEQFRTMLIASVDPHIERLVPKKAANDE